MAAFAAAVAVLLAVLAVAIANRSDDSSRDSVASGNNFDDRPTTTESIEQTCEYELSEWVAYVTGRSGGQIMDAGAHFGIWAPEFEVIKQAWQTCQTNLYQVGRDQASDRDFTVIQNGCRNLGASYQPGQLPPG